jgi:hypothetical protein
MDLSRFTRRIVATITGTALLLYLATTAAHACILSAAGPQDSAMPEPCCEAAAEIRSSAELSCCQVSHSLLQATPETAKVAALAAVELPMTSAYLDPSFSGGCVTAAVESPPPHANSPPLHTLYCRLRN